MQIKYLIIFIVLSFSLNISAQQDQLDSLVNQAVRLSPKLKMLQAKQSAAESKVNVNSNLPDPVLTLGLANLPTNSFSFTQEPMTGKIVGLSQAVPFPGKLGANAAAAGKDAEIVSEEYKDAENEIIKNVSQNYYELIYIRKAIAIAKESKTLLQKIAEVVNANYAVSKSSQQNVLKVQLEITTINDKIVELKDKENSIVSLLNSYLLKNQNSPILTDTLPQINYISITQSQLDSIAVNHRPFLSRH